jgi:hypothetical protein
MYTEGAGIQASSWIRTHDPSVWTCDYVYHVATAIDQKQFGHVYSSILGRVALRLVPKPGLESFMRVAQLDKEICAIIESDGFVIAISIVICLSLTCARWNHFTTLRLVSFRFVLILSSHQWLGVLTFQLFRLIFCSLIHNISDMCLPYIFFSDLIWRVQIMKLIIMNCVSLLLFSRCQVQIFSLTRGF